MALFGNEESAEVTALQQRLAAAHGMIAEPPGWVAHLRGAGTGASEAELRGLRSAVEQGEHEVGTLTATRRQLAAEVETPAGADGPGPGAR
ncbi:hypothetical protein LZG04_37505 [Saccharothrix sp. S26]|uniref:hypothetical protein n=1 Tax=Saccharothrix sp. S26 TaxID=2907215 RepID=UPI001F3EDA0D|nr:hypothetical protein [Saccharothrix sp. S26]MCE7000475.1 hypothetical protein [Saccharothrix sp. S26]